MKSTYGLLAVGFLSTSVLGAACVSGSTVEGSGGQTGNNGLGGHINVGLGGSKTQSRMREDFVIFVRPTIL